MNIPKRVQRGVSFLNERLGSGWWDEVDLETLDLLDPQKCVLAQVVGPDFYRARMTFEMSMVTSNKLGFSLELDEREYAWNELTQEWRRIITELRLQEVSTMSEVLSARVVIEEMLKADDMDTGLFRLVRVTA